ncbi:Uncharacterised protein [Mycoplasmopsis columbinasalis]|uniref:Uncharacterized protein n=1 Tax=Mycoplasmopsis columbinasalis TaxID=114880 RepID=A0A449B9S2_9BACT|nr:Uncharacterised protein [Mycoplasmopsis columbinasalis]
MQQLQQVFQNCFTCNNTAAQNAVIFSINFINWYFNTTTWAIKMKMATVNKIKNREFSA